MKDGYSAVKDVAKCLRHTIFGYRGSILDVECQSSSLMRKALTYTAALIIDLLPDDTGSITRFRSWLGQVSEFDVYEFGLMLKEADGQLKGYLTAYSDRCTLSWPQFKAAVGHYPYNGYLDALKPVFQSFLRLPSAADFGKLNTFVNFLRRANLQDVNLEQECEEEYVAFEENFDTTYDDDLIDEMVEIVDEWMEGFCYEDTFVPRHGPGSVAGMIGQPPVFAKYQLMRSDALLEYFQKDIGPLNEWTPWCIPRGETRCSEIVCVPKSPISNRTISREPAALQYFQQGIRRSLCKHFDNSPLISPHIDLRHQEKSADLARVGSIVGEFATIDLSSASDSVSLELVKRLCRHQIKLLRGLICTRSTETKLPSGRIIRLKKFAPMGSAVCFPVETLIFATACECACRRTAPHRRSQGFAHDYRVYGDDIVIRERYVEQLVTVLRSLHFKVNEEKSFSGSRVSLNFREACGGEYFDGYEVTPFRFPRFFKGIDKITDQSADHISSYVSFANKAYERGYLMVRRAILEDLKAAYPDYSRIHRCTDGLTGIQTDDVYCTNFDVKSRYAYYPKLKGRDKKAGYQQAQYRCKTVVADDDCATCRQIMKRMRVSKAKQAQFCYRKDRANSYELCRLHEWWLHRLGDDYDVALKKWESDAFEIQVKESHEQICAVHAVMRARWV